eukprot:TRINITY_DN15696_c0_g1_i1.p1 TRINITY_DN15696_c0_g1~~TRINITY_DN15696_c0_g1_i1.p1  ORF type:complete len:285 (+),score=38.05 TRINITY_DN15696_c0_g1_i1:70-855(+)
MKDVVQLPDEIYTHVFTHLSPKDLATVAASSPKLKEISEHNDVWSKCFEREFPADSLHVLPARSASVKEAFRERVSSQVYRFGNWLVIERESNFFVVNRYSTEGVVVILPKDAKGSLLLQTTFESELEHGDFPNSLWESACDGTLTKLELSPPANAVCSHHINEVKHDVYPLPNPRLFFKTASALPADFETPHGYKFEEGMSGEDSVVSITHPARSGFIVRVPAESRGYILAGGCAEKDQLVWGNRNLGDMHLPGSDFWLR